MQKANDKTVLFLFGRQPAEAALLEAQALHGPLQRHGWGVQLAGVSAGAVRRLRERFGQPAACLAWEPVGLPVIGRLFLRRAGGAPVVVHAWDLEAAGAGRRLAGQGSRLCVTLDRSQSQGPIPRWPNPVRSADVVVSHQMVPTASPVAQVRGHRLWELPPAVDVALVEAARARRQQVRASLGLTEDVGPVVVTPSVVQRGSGHFEAAWGTFILRRGGIPARLVLPHAGRESSRIRRFAAACHEQAGVVVAGAGVGSVTARFGGWRSGARPWSAALEPRPQDRGTQTGNLSLHSPLGWLDLLAAADIVVLPDVARMDAVLAAHALASGRVVVVRSVAEPAGPAADSLLSPRTCMFTADARPLSLARALLRAWEDRETASNLARTAGQEVARRCDPAAVAETYLQIYSKDSKYL